ncbi:hypothetical protein ABZ860_18840 [Microbispora sp. NPDC046973]|uniref:hypothetical protein n=1 Tax=Microbispora sp. NPDC046973 TaxID=3155022 RepID=UPI0033F3B4EF
MAWLSDPLVASWYNVVMTLHVTAVTETPPGFGQAAVTEPAARTRRRATSFVAAGLLFVFTVAQRPAHGFRFDAQAYWSGAKAAWANILSGGLRSHAGLESIASSATKDGALAGLDSLLELPLRLRGILAYLSYSPPALMDRLFPGSGEAAVLVENSLIMAVVGAVLLPAIAKALGVRGPLVTGACAALVWLVGARFAPYPLMDLPAAAAFLGAVLFAAKRSPLGIALTGLCAGIAFNIRPAYLLPLAAVTAVVAVLHRFRALWLLPGAAVALLPQFLLNVVWGFWWVPVPPATWTLARYQADLGSYVVRYDTVLSSLPRQFYCDPHMASAAGGGLLHTLIGNFPWSAVFLAEKFSAALAWSPATPYSNPTATESYSLLLPVSAVTVCGALALIALAVRCRRGPLRGYSVTVVATLIGVCATLVTSSTETRFALPVVLLGVLGCALLLSGGKRAMSRGWWIAAGAGTLLVVVFAGMGLGHPLPAGAEDPMACAILP